MLSDRDVCKFKEAEKEFGNGTRAVKMKDRDELEYTSRDIT